MRHSIYNSERFTLKEDKTHQNCYKLPLSTLHKRRL